MMRQQVLRTYAMTLDQANKLVADVPCARFADLPFPSAKHPGWVLGHLCLAADMMIKHIEQPENPNPDLSGCPAEWADAVSPGKEIVAERSRFGLKDELIAKLEALHAELSAAYESASDDLLAAPFPNPDYRSFFPTIGDAAFYILAYHEGYHLGQLSSWRRASGFEAAPE